MSMQAARPLASCSCGALGRLLIVSVSSYEVCGLTAQLMGPFESCARSLVGVVSVHRHLFFFCFFFFMFFFCFFSVFRFLFFFFVHRHLYFTLGQGAGGAQRGPR